MKQAMITGTLIIDCDECGVSQETTEIDGGTFVPVLLSSGTLYVPLSEHWPDGWIVADGLDLCPRCAAQRSRP